MFGVNGPSSRAFDVSTLKEPTNICDVLVWIVKIRHIESDRGPHHFNFFAASSSLHTCLPPSSSPFSPTSDLEYNHKTLERYVPSTLFYDNFIEYYSDAKF